MVQMIPAVVCHRDDGVQAEGSADDSLSGRQSQLLHSRLRWQDRSPVMTRIRLTARYARYLLASVAAVAFGGIVGAN